MSIPSDQSSKASGPQLTARAGNPVADNQNSLSTGPRGPLLMQDCQLLEKLAHQNRERIPYAEPPLPLHGDADRYNYRDGNDDYTQPGNLFRLFNAE